MGLLAPIMLLLAGAAAVPVLLHLLQRQRGPRIVFPALRYLHRAEKEQARRIRLRQILLLALRVAALALIALAAARPFLRAGGTGHPPSAVVIVLDNSASSAAVQGDERVLDGLEARARQTLAAATGADRVWLILAGAPWLPAFTGTPAQLAARLRTVEPTAAAADLSTAVARAQSLLAAASGDRPREIEVLSDLQATSLGRGPAAAASAGAAPVVVWAGSGSPPPNAGVTSVLLGGGFAPRAGEHSTVTAAVGGGAGDSVTARLFVDGRPVAAALTPVGSAATLPLPPQAAGLLTGRVEIDADALRLDDRRYFAVRIGPPPTVGLSADAPFVDAALDVLSGAGRIRRAGRGAGEIRIAPAARGVQAIRDGATVVVLPPASPDLVAAANGRLATAGVPWRFGPAASRGVARLAPPDGDAELAAALAPARIRLAYGLQHTPAPAHGDTTLLRLSDGEPWAVRGGVPAGGRFIILGSPLTAEATTLPTSAALIPLLDRVLTHWAARGEPVHGVRAGESVLLPDAATRVAGPGTERVAVTGGAAFRPTMPGVYRVLAGDSVVSVFAVNVPAAETPLARAPAAELAAHFPGHRVVLAADARAWSHAIFQRRFGYQLWPALLAAALLLLLLEMWIAAGGRAAARDRARTRTRLQTQS